MYYDIVWADTGDLLLLARFRCATTGNLPLVLGRRDLRFWGGELGGVALPCSPCLGLGLNGLENSYWMRVVWGYQQTRTEYD